MSIEEEGPRRRVTDVVSPAVQLFVEKEVGRTRHHLREEFQVAMQGIANQVSDLRAFIAEEMTKQARDHAIVITRLDHLQQHVLTFTDLKSDVDDLKASDKTDHAVQDAEKSLIMKLDQNRKWFIGLAATGISLVLACVALVLSHVA